MMRAPSGICLAREAVGIAAAVPALVREAHERGELAQALDRLEDARADLRMLAHVLALAGVERAALAQELRGDADLADVVQHGGVLDVAQRRRIEAEHPADPAREVGDRERVARGVHVLRLERTHERVDRGQEARLELARDALAVERQGGLQRHALEQGELGRRERRRRPGAAG